MNGKTVANCWALYAQHLSGTVNADANQRYWGRLSWFSDKDAYLSPAAVTEYIRIREEAGCKPATINRELAMLRGCLRHAVMMQVIDKAPIIRGLPKPPPRMRVLTKEEAGAMVRAADKRKVWYEQVYVRLALGTAQRPEAVMGLSWAGVDWGNKTIDFRLSTSPRMKKRAIVPMNQMTEAALKMAQKHPGSDHVLHHNNHRMDNPRRMIKRIASEAGLADVSPHVLRHTSASLLLQGGADLLYVSRLLAHASTKITEQVYFQHPPRWLKSVTDKLVF